jgi:PIN domain nuclease of toxin-antitoxin system
MLLLDTHVWFWSLSEPERLSKAARDLIQQTKTDQRAVASISIWELAMMAARGRIELKIGAGQWLDYAVNKSGIHVFALTPEVALESCSLPGDIHGDPADRIIVATARLASATLVTKDRRILKYPYVESVW